MFLFLYQIIIVARPRARIGASLIFNGLTIGRSETYCKKMAIRSVFLSLILVFCFGFWGSFLFQALGIQMESFRIAGGLLGVLLASLAIQFIADGIKGLFN